MSIYESTLEGTKLSIFCLLSVMLIIYLWLARIFSHYFRCLRSCEVVPILYLWNFVPQHIHFQKGITAPLDVNMASMKYSHTANFFILTFFVCSSVDILSTNWASMFWVLLKFSILFSTSTTTSLPKILSEKIPK